MCTVLGMFHTLYMINNYWVWRAEGIISEGMISECMISEGMISEGMISEGMISEGMISEGMISGGMISEGINVRHSWCIVTGGGSVRGEPRLDQAPVYLYYRMMIVEPMYI